MPILLYGLEACPLTKSDLYSLDFVINIEIVKYCQSVFNFVIPSVQIAQKSEKFVKKINVIHECGIS